MCIRSSFYLYVVLHFLLKFDLQNGHVQINMILPLDTTPGVDFVSKGRILDCMVFNVLFR